LRPRVGHIQFLNSLPFYYGLIHNGILTDIELTKGTPTELNKLLLEGKLDISLMSSIEYCRNHEELVLMPDLTISSDGEVKSILLLSKVPIEELNGRTVALTNTSATSQVLLKIILNERYRVNAQYFVSPPELGSMFLEADAALLIGDSALRAAYRPKEKVFVYDLGQEWKDMTGHKMVYAVWAVRRGFADAKPELGREVYRAFLESMKYSVEHVEEIAVKAARWEPFDAEFLRDYFLGLQFAFDEGQQAGLLEYYRRANALGYCPDVRHLKFVEV